MELPEHIKQKVELYVSPYDYPGTVKFHIEFGYSLAQQEIKERDDRIDKLRGLIGRMYNEFIRAAENRSPAVSEDNWRKFQKENNI